MKALGWGARGVGVALVAVLLAFGAPVRPAIAAPQNDARATAETIGSLPFRTELSTTDATTGADDPDTTGPECQQTEYATVWYRYSAPAAGVLTVDAAGDYDTVLAVFAESDQGLTQVDCTTFFNGQRRAQSTFRVASGVTYLLMVGALSPAGGALVLTVEESPSAPLDVAVTVDRRAKSLPRSGAVTLTGTVSCSRPASVRLEGLVTQGSVSSRVSPPLFGCPSGGVARWTARSREVTGGRLGHGRARVQVSVIAWDNEDQANVEERRRIRIRAPRIAFARSSSDSDDPFRYEIFTMAENGTAVRRLTRNGVEDNHPAFSPDGQRIAFTSARRGVTHIYVMNADGSRVRRLTSAPHADALPDWSPDGEWVVFTRHFDRQRQSDLFAIRVAGGAARRLTDTAGREFAPDWSPDGRLIAFTKFVDRRSQFGVGVVRASGRGFRWLALNPRSRNGYADANPSWSPTGTSVAFTREDRDLDLDIFTVRRDGTRVRRLTDLGAETQVPAWGPDGRIAVMRDSALALLDPASGEIRSVTPDSDTPRPYWWPDWAQTTTD